MQRSSFIGWTLVSLAALSATGCFNKPWEKDPPEIASRYDFRFTGECSSWLSSSITGYRYCASPAFEVDLGLDGGSGERPLPEVDANDAAAMKELGKTTYDAICVTCHMADGQGQDGAFPPLAGAGSYYGSPQNMAKIVIGGLTGEITVLGKTYNGAMPAHGHLHDIELAAVLTYVRTSFGNNDGPVSMDDIAAAR